MLLVDVADFSEASSVSSVATLDPLIPAVSKSSEIVCGCAVQFIATITADGPLDRAYERTFLFEVSSIDMAPSLKAGTVRRRRIKDLYQLNWEFGSDDSV